MSIAKILAWCVHCYTALGLVAAAAMALFIVHGDERSFRWAMGMMIVATIIDATDGWLARRARVEEVLPQFDGRRLDDIVDFQTYTSLPLLFIWRAGILPDHFSWVLLVPLLASLYGFSQSNAKTEDHYFLGFPSYWNVVAVYFYWLQPEAWVAVSLIIALAILTFIPSLYLYPSRGGPLSKLTNVLGSLWGVLMILITYGILNDPKLLVWISLAFPLYYFLVSWWITLRRWLVKDRQWNSEHHRLSNLAAETSSSKD